MNRKLLLIFIILIAITAVLCSCSDKSGNQTLPSQAPESIPLKSTEPPQVISPSPSQPAIPSQDEQIENEPFVFTILAAGDVMAHNDNLRSAFDVNSGEYSFNENYMHVKKIVEEADLALCNLETVTAGSESGYTSYPLFNTPASILDGLKYAGFDAIITANNHSLDRGETGILKTLDEIKNRGLLSTGTYAKNGVNYLTVDIKGIKVSILAYTQHLNGNLPLLTEDKYFMINKMDKGQMVNDIRDAYGKSDLVLVYLHWGNEYTRATEDWQPEYAYDLIDAGADIILGTHPHVIRPDEVVTHNGEAKYIIYSMGNYISNFVREDNRTNAIYTEDGVMINMSFSVNDSGGVVLESVVPIPTWPYKYTDETGIHYEIIPVREVSSVNHISSYAVSEAIDSYNRTMESLKGFIQPD